jgi:hemerythrin-like metal-binding protein
MSDLDKIRTAHMETIKRQIPPDLNVLCAEDNDMVQDQLRRRLFDPLGIKVQFAIDGWEAWSLFKKQQFDVVFTDFDMPGISGADLINRIRDSGSQIPILMVTSYSRLKLVTSLDDDSVFLIDKAALNKQTISSEGDWPQEKEEIWDIIEQLFRNRSNNTATSMSTGSDAGDAVMTEGTKWGEDMVLGIQEIDNQHKALFSLANRLRKVVNGGDISSIGITFMAVMNYAGKHLKDEEELLTKHKYPSIENHKKMHVKILEDVTSLHEQYKTASDTEKTTISRNFCDFLENWLITHIGQEDRQHCTWLKNNVPGLV